jgi:DNA polymerase-1
VDITSCLLDRRVATMEGSVERIAFDIETYDPNLFTMGSGVYRKDGYVLGVSIATEDGFHEYYNLNHRGVTQDVQQKSIGKITEWLASPGLKIGGNPLYDMDWLTNSLGIPINGTVVDIQGVEALLDEYALSYSNEALTVKYLNEHKKNEKTVQWCADHDRKGDPRQWLFEMPYEVVRDYAIGDVDDPLRIFRKQEVQLTADELGPVFDLECALLPLLSTMRRNGIGVDRKRRFQLSQQIRARLKEEEDAFNAEYGNVNIKSAKQLASLFDSRGWDYGTTPAGNPSFNKEQLEAMDNPFAHTVLDMREKQTMLNNFVEGAWVDYDTGGRIHCDFLPLRKDTGGTVTGRFSSQHPNLQQCSADKYDPMSGEHEFTNQLREVFVPDEGQWYGCIDYSQIEYRLIAHYAKGEPKDYTMSSPAWQGARAIQARYNADPDTDYHQAVMDLMHITDRTTAKRLNFGIAYFMGPRSMARKFHWPYEQAVAYYKAYIEMVPFINPTRYAVVDRAKKVGFIKTIYGRRARISPEMHNEQKEYVAFNRLIQGGAADLNKLAMVNAYKAGIFDILTPHITVHDELGVSVPKTIEGIEAYEELKHVMETALPFRVPIKATAEYGPNWGQTVKCHTKGLIDTTFDKMRKEVA